MRCRQQQQKRQHISSCATCIYYHLRRLRCPCFCSAQARLDLGWLKCHQRKNKWQQFSINCICAKLSSILASGACGRMWQVASAVGSCSSSIRSSISRCWSSQTPLTLQLATITFSQPVARLPGHLQSGKGRGGMERVRSERQLGQLTGNRGQAPIAC